jgi:hypothetical protein
MKFLHAFLGKKKGYFLHVNFGYSSFNFLNNILELYFIKSIFNLILKYSVTHLICKSMQIEIDPNI